MKKMRNVIAVVNSYQVRNELAFKEVIISELLYDAKSSKDMRAIVEEDLQQDDFNLNQDNPEQESGD